MQFVCENGKLARSLWSKRPTATLGWAIGNVSPILLFAETSSTLATSSAALRVHETKDRRDASTAIGSLVGKQSVITFLFLFFLSMDNQLFFNRRLRIFGQQNLFQFGINLISRICSPFVSIWLLNVFCWLWRWFLICWWCPFGRTSCLFGETGENIYGGCLVFLFLWYLIMEGLRVQSIHEELAEIFPDEELEHDVARAYLSF